MSKKELKAFTLIELLVVIGIIGILSAIGVVSFGAVREKARRGACVATLRSNFNSDENLVAYWNFDEGAGTTAKDFWGNNGTISNASYTNDAIIDSALSFSDDIPNPDQVDVTSGKLDVKIGTVELWYKHLSPLSNADVLFGPKCGLCDFPIHIAEWDDITTPVSENGFRIYNLGTWKITTGATVFSSNWHHIVVTWNVAQDPLDLQLFVDGQLIGQNNYNPSWVSAGGLYIGADSRGDRSATGIIDEVIIYNRALSADEIASHYKACKK